MNWPFGSPFPIQTFCFLDFQTLKTLLHWHWCWEQKSENDSCVGEARQALVRLCTERCPVVSVLLYMSWVACFADAQGEWILVTKSTGAVPMNSYYHKGCFLSELLAQNSMIISPWMASNHLNGLELTFLFCQHKPQCYPSVPQAVLKVSEKVEMSRCKLQLIGLQTRFACRAWKFSLPTNLLSVLLSTSSERAKLRTGNIQSNVCAEQKNCEKFGNLTLLFQWKITECFLCFADRVSAEVSGVVIKSFRRFCYRVQMRWELQWWLLQTDNRQKGKKATANAFIYAADETIWRHWRSFPVTAASDWKQLSIGCSDQMWTDWKRISDGKDLFERLDLCFWHSEKSSLFWR